MKTKTCTSCGKEKSTSNFQIRRASKDGLTARCKKCLSDYDKTRANLPKRVEARKLYAKTETGKAAAIRAKRKYIERCAVKRGVHVITGNAIRDGKLVKQPCEVCGAKKVHAHHDDYAKPLDVRWLCPKHHMQWHRENGEGLNVN